MVCYVDTSVLVALCVNEPKSEDVSAGTPRAKTSSFHQCGA